MIQMTTLVPIPGILLLEPTRDSIIVIKSFTFMITKTDQLNFIDVPVMNLTINFKNPPPSLDFRGIILNENLELYTNLQIQKEHVKTINTPYYTKTSRYI